MAKPKFDFLNIADHRRKLGVNQHTFWSPLGVTQSGGSRYGSGRNIPTPTAILLTLRETGKISIAEMEAAVAFIKKVKSKK